MNDNMNEDGLLPSLLVVVSLPKLQSTHLSVPDQSMRMQAITAARGEMETIVGECRIATEVIRKLPLPATHEFKPVDKFLVYREQEKIKGKGPLKIELIEENRL